MKAPADKLSGPEKRFCVTMTHTITFTFRDVDPLEPGSERITAVTKALPCAC